MLSIHPQARTTPAVRREIARSTRAHRRAGPALRGEHRDNPQMAQARGRRTARTARAGRTSCPGKPPRRSAPSSVRCAAPPAFPLDDLTFVVSHFLPHLNRDAVYRILKAEGPGAPAAGAPEKAGERHLQGL